MGVEHHTLKVVLAAYYSPGIRALEVLFGKGYRPEQIMLLSHRDARNECLLSYAEIQGIALCTAPAKSDETHEWISSFSPDAILSVYYREIFPARVLDIPSKGAVNLHPSLLPRYRGAFSSPWVILNGDAVSGYTYHYMNEKVDEGDVLLQRELAVRHGDTAYSLYHRLIGEALNDFGSVLDMVANGEEGVPQQGEGTYFSRDVPFDGVVDPSWGGAKIDRFIRAMYFPPFRGAIVRLKDGREVEVASLDEYKALIDPTKK